MHHAHSADVGRSGVSLHAIPARLAALQAGARLTLIGLDSALLRTAAEASPVTPRQMLELDLGEAGTTAQTVGRILDDLADLALAIWPHWFGGAEAPPDVLAVWRREAERRAAAGQPPRFRRTPPRVELRHLLAALDPAGLVLIATLDPAQPHKAAARIAALEWCSAAGASVAILFPNTPPPTPPFDRVLYGALDIVRPTRPVLDRLIAPRGKPHGASVLEQRLQDALAREADLAPLFHCNKTIRTDALGFEPRVDMVWDKGRVVVELDGPEHGRDPNYGADRHRDYELLVAGYLVLRLTNAEVRLDLARAVDKIRRVVNLRRGQRD